MEKPQYGRTGLLSSRLGGLPVSQPRLLVPGSPHASRPLKWYPSLLTIPQQLLDALRREDDDADGTRGANVFSSDPTLVTYLRMATIAECLALWWRRWAAARAGAAVPTRVQLSTLYREVLRWCREEGAGAGSSASPSSHTATTSFFIPSYKLLVMKEDKKVGEYAALTWRSVWLLGKDSDVNDVALEHPSCSSQHAALEMRFAVADEAALHAYVTAEVDAIAATAPVLAAPSAAPPFGPTPATLRGVVAGLWRLLEEAQAAAGGDAAATWTVELQLIDLASTNRTKLDGEVVAAAEAVTVIDSDVLEFGCSTRKYVIMRSS